MATQQQYFALDSLATGYADAKEPPWVKAVEFLATKYCNTLA